MPRDGENKKDDNALNLDRFIGVINRHILYFNSVYDVDYKIV